MSDRTCGFPGCNRRHCAKGLCRAHYNQQREGHSLTALDESRRLATKPEDTFFRRVAPGAAECWLWLGAKDGRGYGRFREQPAHRWSYEYLRCEVPPSLFLDHLCRNRACVNPWHLEPVPNEVNIRRGTSPTAINARKTHCPAGHEYGADNTYLYGPRGTWRKCRTCQTHAAL